MYIEKVNSPADVKKLSVSEMNGLGGEIRQVLLNKLSSHGGHVGPNLGMVEATIALHYVFDSPTDKIVYDVSHQSYTHKILTGRRAAFMNADEYDEVSGYSEPSESEHDFFVIGHTSTSVSLASGLAKARDLKGEAGNVIAVIGDGSLSGGEAFEGLNVGAELGTNFIVIVNDNQMSIAENHGGLYRNLQQLRETEGQAPCNYFKAMGYDYLYVKDGNDVEQLIEAFREVKDKKHPVVVHINTLKGKGYKLAEEQKERFHYSVPFDLETGNLTGESGEGEDYVDLTAGYLLQEMKKDPTVVGITAGTPTVFGFTPERRKEAGRQFIDMGIAEEQAVAMASAIAAGGGKPVFGVYSTFIQRAYDQFFQEMSLNRSRVTVLDFLGGLSGSDNTHSGAYDVTMFSNIPGVTMLVPTSARDYLADLAWATAPAGSADAPAGPAVIRVPGEAILAAERDATLLPVTGGQIADRPQSASLPASASSASGGISAASVRGTVSVTAQHAGARHMLDWRVNQTGSQVAIIGLGNAYPLAEQTAAALSDDYGITATVIDPRQCTSLDSDVLESLRDGHQQVITLEDGQLEGGWGEKVTAYYANHHVSDGSRNPRVLNFGAAKEFTDRVSLGELNERYGLTVEQVTEAITRCF